MNDLKTIDGPHGRKYFDHDPKRVCLVGMGPSINDYMTQTLTQELTPAHHDEVWGINMVGNPLRCDLIFWMDDLAKQAAMTPHFLVPTKELTTVINGQIGGLLAQLPIAQIHAFGIQVQSLAAEIPEEQWTALHQQFDTLIANGFLNQVPIGAVSVIRNAMAADKKASRVDPHRTLAGLLQVVANHGTPVITSVRRPEIVPNSFDYPIDEISEIGVPIFGKPYLNQGVSMAIAYALWKGVDWLGIYGCDFTYPNRDFAESGRACVEAWITVAAMRGMTVYLSPHTSLMDTVSDHGIYGYGEQPMVSLPDGRVFAYRRASDIGAPFGGKYEQLPTIYQPEDSSGRTKEVTDVLPVAAQADSASGPAGTLRDAGTPGDGAAAGRQHGAPDWDSAETAPPAIG